VALEKIRQSAKPATTKEIDDYIARAKLDPANAGKTDYELYKQWAVDKQGTTPELKRLALIGNATKTYGDLSFMARDALKEQGINSLEKYIDFVTKQSGSDTPSGGGDLKAKATAAFGSYEPDKYEYRVGPEGNIQRKPKG
jgi:hypothetical protein